MCCHTETHVAGQTCYLTQPQYSDTWPTCPSADPTIPGVWRGSHRSTHVQVTGMTPPVQKPQGESGNRTQVRRSRGRSFNHRAKRGGKPPRNQTCSSQNYEDWQAETPTIILDIPGIQAKDHHTDEELRSLTLETLKPMSH